MKNFLIISFCLFLMTAGFSQTQIGTNIQVNTEKNGAGSSVSLSSDGSIIAIGAPLSDINGNRTGRVRVYRNVNNIWTQIGSAINGEADGDNFGISLSLSSDGSILAVGAPENNGIGVKAGHVRVYRNVNDVWTQIGSDIDGEVFQDSFGTSVSLSSDGTIVAIGAPDNDQNGNSSGHVRIYKNVNDVWTQIGSDIDGTEGGDLAGTSVSLSQDGSAVVIGVPGVFKTSFDEGRVRIYDNVNNAWVQRGNDITGENDLDAFGLTVGISGNGRIIAGGANGNDDEGSESGHVRVFENINNNWTQIGSNINGRGSDRAGESIGLSKNGLVLAVGSRTEVRIYQNIGNNWIQISSIDRDEINDLSGTSISLSDDGTILAIGGPKHNNFSGQVRIFDLSSVLSTNAFVETNTSLYPNPSNGEFTIQLKENLLLENISIYNTLGKVVLQSKEANIKTEKLSQGVYFVQITTDQGKTSKKLIIE